jgi:hypothetical protein
MEQRHIAGAPGRAFSGAFRDDVRGVFADHSARSRWLQRLVQRPAPGAEQRWEDEGGRTR